MACSVMAVKQSDLDQLRSDFLAWQQATSCVSSQNVGLKSQLATVERQLLASQTAERAANETASQLREQVQKLQHILLKQCDMEEENRQLKEQIASLKVEAAELEKQHRQQMTEALESLEVAQASHHEEITALKDEAAQEMKREVGQLEKTVAEQKAEIRQLRKELNDYEKDHHTQLVKIRLEYDAKLLKMQKQTAKPVPNQQSSVGHEIFRKKLQAAKADSDKEIMSLKRTVADLEKRLAGGQQKRGKLMESLR
jgi:polyhydroxyalkanoate synthesis regulator phasin